jgi:hypothetical protein
MTEEKIVYMIRRRSDGLLSSGGNYPQFGKTGKVWKNIGHVKNHLHQFIDYNGKVTGYKYNDCEIVTLKSVLTTDSTLDLHNIFSELVDKVKSHA